MPFTCATLGQQVHVEKAEQRNYPVIGKRQQKTLRICSGSSGKRCRNLQIHKFTFDCAGRPVQWVDAAAAIMRGQPWKATLIRARLTLRDWPDGLGLDRRLPLSLPPGFAPAPPSGLSFSQQDPPPSGSPHATRAKDGGPNNATLHSERPRAETQGEKSSPPRPTQVVALRQRDGDDADASAPRPLSMPSIDPGWTATAIVNRSAREAWWRHFLPSAVPNALLAFAGIGALLLSALAVAARPGNGHRLLGCGFAALGRSPAEPDFRAAADERPPPNTPERSPGSSDTIDPVAELASALRETPSPPASPADWAPVAEMQATAGALLDLVRQIVADDMPDGAVRDVLVADLSVIASRLEGAELADALSAGRADLAQSIYTQAILDLERARTLSRIERERALQVVDQQQRAPETVDEACAFLGVNPRAGNAVVKKVVDALRQNWHPDHASDEADRRTREDRIKHINAAWDLIRAR